MSVCVYLLTIINRVLINPNCCISYRRWVRKPEYWTVDYFVIRPWALFRSFSIEICWKHLRGSRRSHTESRFSRTRTFFFLFYSKYFSKNPTVFLYWKKIRWSATGLDSPHENTARSKHTTTLYRFTEHSSKWFFGRNRLKRIFRKTRRLSEIFVKMIKTPVKNWDTFFGSIQIDEKTHEFMCKFA